MMRRFHPVIASIFVFFLACSLVASLHSDAAAQGSRPVGDEHGGNKNDAADRVSQNDPSPGRNDCCFLGLDFLICPCRPA